MIMQKFFIMRKPVFNFIVLILSAGLSLSGCTAGTNNPPMVISNEPFLKQCTGYLSQLPWRKDVSDISQFPVHVNHNKYMQTITQGGTPPLFANFGSGTYQGSKIGIPYTVVLGSQPNVPVTFRWPPTSKNPDSYPIPPDAPIEEPLDGDRHVLAVQVRSIFSSFPFWFGKSCDTYELYNAFKQNNGQSWKADGGGHFSLHSYTPLEKDCTSADAAGLPIFPYLVRYAEVASGSINHTLRFTIGGNKIGGKYIYPARHSINKNYADHLLPMGLHLRLKKILLVRQHSRPKLSARLLKSTVWCWLIGAVTFSSQGNQTSNGITMTCKSSSS